MRDDNGLLLCRACSARIGVYERFRWWTPDGRIVDSTEGDPNAHVVFEPLHAECAMHASNTVA
jgi:hypothetical protein